MASEPIAPSSASIKSSGRRAAVKALLAIDKAGLLADDLFDQMVIRESLDLRERAFMVELVRGILRYRGTLDWRLGLLSDRPIARLPTLVQIILRLGAYQLLYLDKIPGSAAVNESVQLMKNQGKRLGRDWSGFVNAVLRGLTRSSEPAWPEVGTNSVEAFAVRYSCPKWIIERWQRQWGKDQTDMLCRRSLEPPPLTLRINRLKTSRADFLQACSAAHLEATPTVVSPAGVHMSRNSAVTDLPGYSDGWFYVEDEAAQLIPLLLDVQPRQRVLDACAAPGGKATHMAALMGNQGHIVAVDYQAVRLDRVMDNCRRLGITVVTPMVGDIRALASRWEAGSQSNLRPGYEQAALFEPFDRILLDAPCSGLGVLRRHPEGKWYKTEESIARHRQLQTELLAATSRLLRPGGLLVYSTCSIEPEETDSVIDEFCRAHPAFHRDSIAPRLPPAGVSLATPQGALSTMTSMHNMDLFFAARLRRIE